MSEISQVAAQLVYSVPPPKGVRPYTKVITNAETGERTIERNVDSVVKEVVIEDLRGKEDPVSLDKTGFQYYRHASQHKSFANDEEIKAEYYPESIELLKKLTGASRVVLFDHSESNDQIHQGQGLSSAAVRRRTSDRPKEASGAPVALVHVDQSTKASIGRVHRHLPAADVPTLLEKRFQIINLWRPIHHPADDWPLTLCDYRSVAPEDVFPIALLYADFEGETMGVIHNANHKWKYLRGMTPDELVLIKCFDSVQDGSVAVYTPHTGFEDSTTPVGSAPRESIELRALVFYE